MKSAASTGIIEWKVIASDEAPCSASDIISKVTINNEPEEQLSNVVATTGDDVLIKISTSGEGHFYWSGPNDFSAVDVDTVWLPNVQPEQSGAFSVVCVNDCGGVAYKSINLTINDNNDGSAFEWPAYHPTIYYDFKDEYPNLEMPTKDLDDCANVAGRKSDGWWTFVWGPNRRADVTDAAIDNMLARFNQDFSYFSDVMGWPRDKRAKNGYRSAIYLFGSGLCTDDADTTALGGWMGSVTYQNESWPMVLASYYPIRCFDPNYPDDGSMGAMVHEGIHALLADLPGAKNSAWFHEGGNTWLQQEMESTKSGDYSSMGFLNAGPLGAPFMPIECYSGWLQDDSFGGPSAEGVNMFEGTQQICTWRNVLGGTQYGNIFPVIFSQIFGDHSVAWLWRYCENRILEGVADTLGDYQMRRLIMEYRAKQTLLDIGKWTGACRSLVDGMFGVPIKSEWQPAWLDPEVWNATPYAKTSDDGNGILTPEYRTTPGWSGANQIPLISDGSGSMTVNFMPIGKNMSCQLCYRATDGSMVYGEPVLGGECTLDLDKKPANNAVFAVVCNTDYIYEGEETRKAHFDYRLKLVDGIKERGHWNVRWYQWDKKLFNLTLPKPVATEELQLNESKVAVYPNPVAFGDNIQLSINPDSFTEAVVSVFDTYGREVYCVNTKQSSLLINSSLLSVGVYTISIKQGEKSDILKVIIV